MTKISVRRTLHFLAFFSSISLQFISGLSDDSPKNGSRDEAKAASSGNIGSKIAIACLLIVGVALVSFFLFKLWQKKKRDEQYARLLKLFEEDDELELELGLRD